MKNKNFLTLFFLLFLISFSLDLNCAVLAKKMHTTTPNPAQTDQKEKAVIEEIKSLLNDGRMPSLSFNQWVDTYAPVLLQSNKEPVKTLGKTLQAIRQGNTSQISIFKILPNFEKAVQEYDQKFRIGTFAKARIVINGPIWYLYPAKNK